MFVLVRFALVVRMHMVMRNFIWCVLMSRSVYVRMRMNVLVIVAVHVIVRMRMLLLAM